MKKMKEKLTAALNAMTFAEAGEFDTARAMLHAQGRPHAVLLVAEGDTAQSDSFAYAVNLCKRIKASMEIFAVPEHVERVALEQDTLETRSAPEEIEALARLVEAEGIPCRVYRPTGNVNEHLFKHIKQHKEIAAVIYDSHGTRNAAGEISRVQQAMERVVHRLSIPLVKVLKRQPAGAAL